MRKLFVTLFVVLLIHLGIFYLYNRASADVVGQKYCNLVQSGHQSLLDNNVIYAEDDLFMSCNPVFNGIGCFAIEKAWVWRKMNGEWVVLGHGDPFVNRTISINCGSQNVKLAAGVVIGNYGPPGDYAITHKVYIPTLLGDVVYGYGETYYSY